MSRFPSSTPRLSPTEIGKVLYDRAFEGSDRNSLRASMQDFEKLSALDQMFILCHLQYLNLQAQARTHALLLGIRETADNLADATIAIADTVTQAPPEGLWSTLEPIDTGEQNGMSPESPSSPMAGGSQRTNVPGVEVRNGFVIGAPEARAPEVRAPETMAPEARASEARTSEARTSEPKTSEARTLDAESPIDARDTSVPTAHVQPSEPKRPRRLGRERAPMVVTEGEGHEL